MLTPIHSRPHRSQGQWLYVTPIVLIAAISIGLYVWQFPDGLADKADAWGQFGDFVGGVLNPLIGLITVLLVLRTIRITLHESARSIALLEDQSKDLAQQLKLAHDQDQRNREAAELNELQKCLDETVRLLRDALDQKVYEHFPVGRGAAGQIEFARGVISKLRVVVDQANDGSLARLRLSAIDNSSWRDQFVEHKRAWAALFAEERQLLVELARYVEEYDSRASHPWVGAYYKRRAYPTALCLAWLSLADPIVLAALRPPEEPAVDIPTL